MKKVFLVLVVAGVLLTSCALKNQSLSPEMVMEMPAAGFINEEAEMKLSSDSVRSDGSGVEAMTVDRLVIKNANLSIAVADPISAMDAVNALAEEMGGFIVSSNLYKTTTSSGVQVPRGNITIRVPAERLDEALDLIKALVADPATGVINESISGQDVTSEYTDAQSRLRNLEAAETALVSFMEMAKDSQDVLDIFRELTYIREDIEVLKGRIKYLEESAAMSAISIELVAEESLQPIEIGGWKPTGVMRDAVQALINALQGLGTALIWFGIFCLPFLIPLGFGIYFLIKGIRKARKKRKNAGEEKIEVKVKAKEKKK